MGQYYKIFMCKEDGSEPRAYTSYDYNNGAKLMEHAYYGNEFVEVALSQIADNNGEPLRIWWVGDYATVEDIPEEKKKYNPIFNAWTSQCDSKFNPTPFDYEKQRYLVNVSTHEYIDLMSVYEQNKVSGWTGSIHPLPLLTAVGNGRGGGDYHGESATNKKSVGIWAGDLLQIVDKIPESSELEYIDISDEAHFRE